MPPPAERWRTAVAARAIVGLGLVAAALPAYLLVEPSWRPSVVRLSCAVLVILGTVRARRWVRDAMEPLRISALDAIPPPASTPELDTRFLRLRDDVTWSLQSRRYFDVVLWPRLLALGGPDLPRPPERRAMRRLGPSGRSLERLIAEVERRA